MQIMHEKGLVTRKKEGKTHIYEATLTEVEAQSTMVKELMETAFRGSAMNLVMGALGSRKSTPQELDQIREFLDKLEGDKS
jgi:predicted transcriptional regulator